MSEERPSLWQELKDRKVIRAVAWYVPVAWGVTLGAVEFTGGFGLPSWVPRVVLALSVLGFPVALVLAWMFEFTPDGIRRAATLRVEAGTRRSPAFVVAGLGLAVGATAAAVILLQGDAPEMNARSVAVFPCSYRGPAGEAYLGGSVGDLLSQRFAASERAPRPADAMATATLYDAMRSTDPVTARRETAAALGTGLTLSCAVVQESGRLTISAQLDDLTTGEPIASARAEGGRDTLDALVDRLANGILSLSAGEAEESLDPLTRTDPRALDEFLQGKWDEFRQGRFEEAYGRFARAVEIDSTFALASIWMADAGNNISGADDAEALARAWRHRDRLSRRDQQYLQARLGPNHPDPSTHAEMRRGFQDFIDQVDRNRAQALYFLAEYALHAPPDRASLRDAAAYLDQALEREPDNPNVLSHILITAARLDEPERYLEASRRWAALDSSALRQQEHRWSERILANDTARALALYDSVPVESARPWLFMDTPVLLVGEWQAAGITSFLDRLEAETGPPATRTARDAHHVLFYAFDALGRPDRAMGVLSELERVTGELHPVMRVLGVLYGSLPTSEAAPGVEVLAERAAAPPESPRDVQHRTVLELWRIAQGDPSQVDAAVAQLRRVAEDLPRALARTVELQASVLEALARLRRGDADGAGLPLQRADSLLREGPPLGGLDTPSGLRTDVYDAMVLATADAYAALGDAESALAVLERESSFVSGHWAFAPRFARDRGRLAALTGDTARAIREYQHYVRMRAEPEAALEDEAEEIREAIRVLQGG